jgi:hypothetical protein
MFEGIHVITGFASKMYIRQNEGTTFGNYLRQGYAFKDAWVNAAKAYQPKISETGYEINAAWAYHRNYENDTMWASATRAPKYSVSPNDFGRKYIVVNN